MGSVMAYGERYLRERFHETWNYCTAYLALFADAIIVMFLVVPDSLAERPDVLVLLFDILSEMSATKTKRLGCLKLATDLCTLCESLEILIDQLS